MQFCDRCAKCRWVCEAHPNRPWDGEHACGCGAPGEPCPECNRADGAPDCPRASASRWTKKAGATDGGNRLAASIR
jgi:hypothetical protein